MIIERNVPYICYLRCFQNSSNVGYYPQLLEMNIKHRQAHLALFIQNINN